MIRFKVGDVVRRTAQGINRAAGTIGTIIHVDHLDHSTPYWVAVGDYTSWWCEDSCELAEPAPSAVTIGPKGSALPTDSNERKTYPMFSGLLAYFPAALASVSNHSYKGNEKHNPGKPMQHARKLSTDHEDCIVRHLVDAQEVKSADRTVELSALAWRALALLQQHLENEGAPTAPAATFD